MPPPKATARAESPAREHTVDEIAEKISAAILEHRLVPGTKLGEDRLAEATALELGECAACSPLPASSSIVGFSSAWSLPRATSQRWKERQWQ